ncbi:MAG: helix-turn-helix domain-containing protein [Lachnospiraceae bacterium]|nr:helix-turn-helix domain-containing protein [Lachnospiraceae bacterium]
MSLSTCNVETDKFQKEIIPHGITMFPIACYDDDLTSMSVPWHWHDEFECIIITEGVAQVHIENQTISLTQGNALFINSTILHRVDKVIESPCRCHSLVFHARLIGGSVDSIFWQKLIAPLLQNTALRYLCLNQSISWQNSIIENMNTTWQIVVDEAEDFENETRFYLSKSFHLIHLHQQLTEHILPDKQEQVNSERIKTMIRYIEKNYQDEISLDMIACSASISKSACLRCFRQMINSTPIRYLIQYRIERAAEALQNSNEQVNVIAITCGFSDVSYFSKCFRELKGYAPLDYRKNRTNNK